MKNFLATGILILGCLISTQSAFSREEKPIQMEIF